MIILFGFTIPQEQIMMCYFLETIHYFLILVSLWKSYWHLMAVVLSQWQYPHVNEIMEAFCGLSLFNINNCLAAKPGPAQLEQAVCLILECHRAISI